MGKNILFLSLILSLSGMAQKRLLSYTPSNLPVFIDKSGDTLTKALLGGLNQPQFQVLDINNDGKKDLIIHDRTGGYFMPFINTGNNDITTYQYSPKYVSCFPKIKKGWVLFVDYDMDGREDLWASIGFRAILFRNITKIGDKQVKFEQISPYLKAYFYSGDPDNTDPNRDSVNFASSFNNIPAIGDVDQDGDIDFFSYEAGAGQMLLYRNRTKDVGKPLQPPVFDLADFCWGNFFDTTFDGIKVFACGYKYYRKKHNGGSALLWFDNDNDGDLDLLMGNADGKNIIFLKNGKKEFNLTQDSIISYDGHWPRGDTVVKLNSFPAAFMLDADGDGAKDILVAPNQEEETSKIDQTRQVWFYKNKGSNSFPNFKFERKNYFTDKILDHGAYSDPVLYDIDADGDLDLILASNGDYAKTNDQNYRLIYYKNIGTKYIPVFKLEDEDLWGLSHDSIKFLSISFGDLNGDGKPDMVAGNIFGSLYYYKNIGSTTTWAFTTPLKEYGNVRVGERSAPQIVDFDKDGKLDLVIGEKDGNFNYFRNTGSTSSAQFTLIDDTIGNFITNEFLYDLTEPAFSYTGYASGEVTDLDGDGKYDMVFSGEEGKVRVMKFNAYNQLNYYEDSTVLFDSAYMSYKTMDFGNFAHPTAGDLDGDGVKDILIGNDRGGINFLKGSVKILDATEIYKLNEPVVYPNPNNGSILNINKRTQEECRFSLFDISGKLLLSETSASGVLSHKLSLETIGDGIYFLQTTTKSRASYYTKVIVSK